MDPALLRIERGRVKGSLTKLKNFADNIPDNKTVEDLETRLEKLEELGKEFKLIDDMLVLNKVESEYDSFEDKYLDIKSALRRKLNEKRRNNEMPAPHAEQLNSTMNKFVDQQKAFFEGFPTSGSFSKQIKLPKVDIPIFSGDYKDWPSFKDLFISSIDSNDELPDVHKLQYLKTLLKGEAASLIKHVSITDSNYCEAWSKLVKRFDKKKQITSAYIKAFINQPGCLQLSASSLRRLSDTSDQLIRGIDVLGSEASGRNPWLIYLILNKLDPDTRKAWAEETKEEEFPSFEIFLDFLNTRCDALEACDPVAKKPLANQSIRNLHTDTVMRCTMCSLGHQLFKCPQYKAMNTAARRNLVSSKSLCFNCLGPGHSAQRCKSKVRCHHCRQSHHSSLHENARDTISQRTLSMQVTDGATSRSATQSNGLTPSSSSFQRSITNTVGDAHINSFATFKERQRNLVILPTALVYIPDAGGVLQTCRILLDSGSQASFISEDCVQRLRLQRDKGKITVHGLSSARTATTRGKITLYLYSRLSSDHHLSVHAHILSKLTAPQPAKTFNPSNWDVLKKYQLADPHFNQSQKIDLLLGADHFLQVLRDGNTSISPNFPPLQNTIFGYIISCPVTLQEGSPYVTSLHSDVCEVDSTLRKFWELEEVPTTIQHYTQEEELCESLFTSTHYVDPMTRRYVVRLPLKEPALLLGCSRYIAMSCLKAMERRFHHDPQLQAEYINFMSEYKALKHLEEISPSIMSSTIEHAYLPHHAVVKPSSTTTKVRVVFHGSAPTSTGVSLNQRLLVGPKVQRDLLPILLSFRTFKVAVVADIEKMYRQILVDERDRNYQRILWRNHPNETLQHLQLTTVTYGTSPAPFLATRSLKQLTIEFRGQFPLAEAAIKDNFYLDDLMGGASNDHEALQLYDQLTTLLDQRGFTLRKWASNSTQFLNSITMDKCEIQSMRIDEHPECIKVLGLMWIPTCDCFTFDVSLPNHSDATKRIILSESSRIFDPIGLISPVTVTFKMLLQQLWLKNYQWDDVCSDFSNKWHTLRNDLHSLKVLRIPRWTPTENSNMQLHGFSDASESAYAAIIYCRNMDPGGNVTVNIIAARTRVSPIKQISIPRLELCAAVLLANLMGFVKSTLNVQHQCFAWTDSTVVLSWLSANPRKWKCFIANRTSTILSVLPRQCWNHVASAENPADLASRGLHASELVKSSLWWQGPGWLKHDWKSGIDTGATQPVNLDAVSQEERDRYLETFYCEMPNDMLTTVFQTYSSLNKIIRLLARCLQFKRNCRSSKEYRASWITSEDLRLAFRRCLLWAQSDAFGKEINLLRASKPIQSSSRILTLTPFLDSSDVLRVGGRLENSTCSYETKHPAILPRDHIFVRHLIAYMHEKHFHAGTSLLLNIIRQNYWILSCRAVIKGHIKQCVICVRHQAVKSQQLMANLPTKRVGAYRAFQNVGVDYAGPFSLLLRRGRGARTTKGYLVVFVCFSTRALHLELSGDLTSETFIGCLKRFASRRGIPSNLYSDNGTNFVGANRKLKEIQQFICSLHDYSLISNFLSSNSISWHFNPPSAPHFGGIWEAGVRSVKKILRRTIGETKLTYEEMNTLLVQIEGLLNSPMNDDISSLDALTPAHFLIGQPLPESPGNVLPISLQGRWRLLQQLHQQFWRRCHVEYLSTLQQRPKWQKIEGNLKVGDLVLVKESNLPPSQWVLGRITTTHPGHDNLVRVVTLRTMQGEFKGPITKLCKLPV